MFQRGISRPFLRVWLNMVDEYPLYLAQQVIGLPLLLLPFLAGADSDSPIAQLLMTLSNPTFLYGLLFTFIVIFLATYLVVRLVVKPRQYTAFLDQWKATVTNIPAEDAAEDFFHLIFRRLTLPLALALAMIGILPGISLLIFGMAPAFAAYFGGFPLFLLLSLLTDFLASWKRWPPIAQRSLAEVRRPGWIWFMNWKGSMGKRSE